PMPSPLPYTTLFRSNLIHKREIPVTIGIFVTPGHRGDTYPDSLGMKNPDHRAQEYDALDDTYARFLIEELLPAVGARYRLSADRSEEHTSELQSREN